MKYVGSKRRIAKHILPIILQDRKEGQFYIEPFCGSAIMAQQVERPVIAADNNPYLIYLLKGIRDGWIPPDFVSEDDYRIAREIWKKDKEGLGLSLKELASIGFIGFCCSYSGKFWGGYARGNTNKGEPRNYCMEQKRNLLGRAALLKDIDFRWCDYHHLYMPRNSLVYMDPPYANTTKYKTGSFNHGGFWDWCRNLKEKGHTVFVSEYESPPDFKCVWEMPLVSSLTKNTGSKVGMERLFV